MAEEKKVEEPKTYVTTERAGFVVAGRRVPTVYEKDKPARPTVGYELQLLDAEAEYELAQGTIALAPASGSAADVSSGGKNSAGPERAAAEKSAVKAASKEA